MLKYAYTGIVLFSSRLSFSNLIEFTLLESSFVPYRIIAPNIAPLKWLELLF